MAGCSKAFAKLCFEDFIFGHGEKARTGYLKLRDGLLKDVSQDRIINSLELRRAHFLDIEDIFIKDYELEAPRGLARRLSSHDALIISMAAWMRTRWGSNVFIVTADERINRFCAAFPGQYGRAFNVRTADVPGL